MDWLNTIRGLTGGQKANPDADAVRALLVNAGREDEPWDCSELRQLDFLTPDGQLNRVLLEDAGARLFLGGGYMGSGPLATFKQCGVDLAPMKTKGDGNCLVNAISRCLVGHEIFHDALRTAMHRELSLHRDFYARCLGGFDDEHGTLFTENLHHAITPGCYLGQIHLFALANVLRRPIILVGSPKASFDGGMQAQTDFADGLFLPLRFSRQECVDGRTGEMPGPLMVGWASEELRHFVALVVKQPADLGALYERMQDIHTPPAKFATRVVQKSAPFELTAADYPGRTIEVSTPHGTVEWITVPEDTYPGDMIMVKYNVTTQVEVEETEAERILRTTTAGARAALGGMRCSAMKIFYENRFDVADGALRCLSSLLAAIGRAAAAAAQTASVTSGGLQRACRQSLVQLRPVTAAVAVAVSVPLQPPLSHPPRP